ncbi:MAG: chemotaxis protein CheB [Actinobacteria bacterium]|nr:MAG: chemotaxis protein CheB [Actinomycetota bacterium]
MEAREPERRKIQRDIVVVGASAGGVEALGKLMRGLPPELPAALFVVLHVLPTGTSVLPEILDRAGVLPATPAVDGDPVERGRVYVAPPDHHLLVLDGTVALSRGPRENGHRPAVDPLFRSAARAYGSRVIAVVLSGALDDGTAGLRFVKSHGGVTIVQAPSDALYPAMPQSAIAHDVADHSVPIAEMPALLCELLDAQIEPIPPTNDPAEHEDRSDGDPRAGILSPITCPECGGTLWEHEEGGVLRFKCHVGHAFTRESLDTAQGQSVEAALWSALRSLEERAELLKRLARRSQAAKRGGWEALERKADAVSGHADVLREVIARLGREPGAESPPEPAAQAAE